MKTPQPRSADDEGLPRPPTVRGRLPRWLLHALVHGETIMFMAIAVALLVTAVAVFAQGIQELVLSPQRALHRGPDDRRPAGRRRLPGAAVPGDRNHLGHP